MDFNKLLDKISEFVIKELKCQPICQFQYHNIGHTRGVVNGVTLIGEDEKVNEQTMFILKASAWLHDIGYMDSYENHEDSSISISIELLSELGLNMEIIKQITDGINATRIPQKASNQVQRIIADADLFNLGTDDFFKESEKLFNEWNKAKKNISELEFMEISSDFLINHHFLTEFAKKHLEPQKKRNLALLEKRIIEIKNKEAGLK